MPQKLITGFHGSSRKRGQTKFQIARIQTGFPLWRKDNQHAKKAKIVTTFHVGNASLLALDTFNSRYRNSIEYIPRISCIEPPEPFTKDNKYYQYEGEVFDIYFRFFAQIEELTGVAINGFRNEAARKIFNHVGQTFGGTKFDVKSKDFEIDWILFNGVTVTVIEVKVKADTGKNNENFEKKIDQIKKNTTIIQHLLEVTGCKDIKVNYIIACPNVSIKEVTDGRILSKHDNFFQSLT